MVSSEPKRVRLPAVAGQFYTSNPEELELQIEHFLKQAQSPDIGAPKAIIAPMPAMSTLDQLPQPPIKRWNKSKIR